MPKFIALGFLGWTFLTHFFGGRSDRFEVAMVKQAAGNFQPPRMTNSGHFTARATLRALIEEAYADPSQGATPIYARPNWVRSTDTRFEVDAKAPAGVFGSGLAPGALGKRKRAMLQALLADRFRLKVRRIRENRERYELLVAGGGVKLRSVDGAACYADEIECHQFVGGQGRGLHAQAAEIDELTSQAGAYTDRPVVNKTGLKGLFQIDTTAWRAMRYTTNPPAGVSQDGVPVRSLPTIFEAFEGLGLKLERRVGRVEILIVDRVEKPVGN